MDELDRPSQEDLDMATELRVAKRKYERRLITVKNPSLINSKSPSGNTTNVNKDRILHTIESIDSLLLGYDNLKRFTPAQRSFAVKILKNAAVLAWNELEKEKNKNAKETECEE
jgi:hypothetical protein